MYRYHVLDSFMAAAYAPLADPDVRPWLAGSVETQHAASLPVAVGASFWGQAAGLALAHYDPASRQARVLDLFVAPACRLAGMGTALLARLEDDLAQRGCERLHVTYRTDAQTLAFERILQKQGWETPRLAHFLFWGSKAIVDAPWMQRRPPPGYTIFPWVELTEAERQAIEARQAAGWAPPGVLPLTHSTDELDPLTSLGLRYQGEVVGWMLNVAQAQGEALYERLFVSPEHRGQGVASALLAESIRRQYAHGGEEGGWRVRPDNGPMLYFVEQRLKPWLIHQAEERTCEKGLYDA